MPSQVGHSQVISAVRHYCGSRGMQTFSPLGMRGKILDIVAVRDRGLVIGVEAKPGEKEEVRRGIGQALDYLDWVHQIYLAVPDSIADYARKLVSRTEIGLLRVSNPKLVTVLKDPTTNPVDESNLLMVLSRTVGFCWFCGRTLNQIPSAEDVYVVHKDDDPNLHFILSQLAGADAGAKGSWVKICKVCEKLLLTVARTLRVGST